MVAFGKRLRESQVQEWKRYYINYKLLKRKVKHYIQQHEAGSENKKNVFKDFSKMLDNQIEKTVLFVLEQEGLYATRLSHLGQQCDALLHQQGGSKITELREAYRSVGRDLLRLLHFVEMNAIAVRKILKKIDKRLGYNFTNYYVNTRANHPYSQLQQVFKQVGIAAVIGTLSRKLAELQQYQGSYVSIYDQPALSNPDPVIDSIRMAINKISSSTNFLSYLSKHAFITEDELQAPSEDHDLDERYHFVSFFLNLANTFLYTVNAYVIVPTADEYSLSLGAAATVCGVVIGSMGVAQLFSSVFFSAWSNKSYMGPLIFSSVALLLGNTFYALAYDLNSISVLLVGRLFCGLGSARAINGRYITDCVPHKLRMQASAGFVSASALGMACAPALACMLQTKFKIWNITFNADTLPGWVMAFAWLVYLVWLWIAFIEPPCVVKADLVRTEGNAGPLLNDAVENGCTQSLVLNVASTQQDEDGYEDEECDSDDDDNEDYYKEPGKPVTSLVAAYRLLTPYVKVHLFIYFMLKYATEILLAESSVITGYYFLWSTTTVSIFLVCLGLTVLPANVFVGNYLSNIFQERQILVACEITVCIGILLSFNILVPYSVPQYVCSAFITFVSAEVLEGVNLSLLSRVMPSRLSRGTYNGGLLSTEAGTLARVVAGGAITVAGYLGEDWLLNATLLPSVCICVLSIVATCFTYNSLS